MPKTVLGASFAITRLHLPACFNRLVMYQSSLANYLQLSGHLGVSVAHRLTAELKEKGRSWSWEVIVEDKSRTWESHSVRFYVGVGSYPCG